VLKSVYLALGQTFIYEQAHIVKSKQKCKYTNLFAIYASVTILFGTT